MLSLLGLVASRHCMKTFESVLHRSSRPQTFLDIYTGKQEILETFEIVHRAGRSGAPRLCTVGTLSA